MKIIIAINYVNYEDKHKWQLQDTALSVLVDNAPKDCEIISFNYDDEFAYVPLFRLSLLTRDSKKEIGNDRRLPYIKEILDKCSEMDCDIFGYMNSDILVNKDFFSVLEKDHDAFVFYKKDIEKISRYEFNNNDIKVVEENPHGVDAVFFRKDWWKLNKQSFSDQLILGNSEWDTCYNSIIQKICRNYILSRTLYHVQHDRKWSIDSRGSINNTLVWHQVKVKYGVPKLTPESKL